MPWVWCKFPDGRWVNVASEDGANALIQAWPNFLSSNIHRGAEQLRCCLAAAGGATGDWPLVLENIYNIFDCSARFSSPDLYSTLAGLEIDAWLGHASGVLKELSKDPKWTRTGELQQYDKTLIGALGSCSRHSKFSSRTFSSGLPKALADFCAARAPPDMPPSKVCDNICCICVNLAFFLPQNGVGSDKVFKCLESSGLLAQVLRCLTQPSTQSQLMSGKHQFLDSLLSHCLRKKKLRKGTGTEDILAAILDKRDGHTGERSPEIMARLETHNKLLELAAMNMEPLRGICGLCGKNVEEPRLVCSRCRGTLLRGTVIGRLYSFSQLLLFFC